MFEDSNKSENPAGSARQREEDNGAVLEIAELRDVAGIFHTQFDQALLELESSRQTISQLTARINGLNNSVQDLNVQLSDEVTRNERTVANHAMVVESLNGKCRDAQAECERLSGVAGEQCATIDSQAGQIEELNQRVEGLADELSAQQAAYEQSAAEHESEQARLNEALHVLQQEHHELNGSHARAREEVEQKDRELVAVSDTVRDLEGEVERLNGDLTGQAEAMGAELHALEQQNHELDSLLVRTRENVEQKAEELEAANETVRNLEGEVERLDAEMRDQAENLGAQLASLQQEHHELNDSHARAREEIEQKDRELAVASDTVRDLEGEVERLNAEMRDQAENLGAQLESLQQEHHELNNRFTHAREDIEQKDRELDTASDTVRSLENEVDRLNAEMHEQAETMEADQEAHESICSEKNNKIEALQHELGILQATNSELLSNREKLEMLNTALQDSAVSDRSIHQKLIEKKDAEIRSLTAGIAMQGRDPGDMQALVEENGQLKEKIESLDTGHHDLVTELEAVRSERDGLLERVMYFERLQQQTACRDETRVEGDSLDDRISVPQKVPDPQEFRALSAGGDDAVAVQDPSSLFGISGEKTGLRHCREREDFTYILDGFVASSSDGGSNNSIMYIVVDNYSHLRSEAGLLGSVRIVDETASFIESCCDEDDVFMRLGDGSFVLLCPDVSAEEATDKAEEIRTAVEEHLFEIKDNSFVATVSIGVCTVRAGDRTSEEIISRGDAFCELAQKSGGNQVTVNSDVDFHHGAPDAGEKHAEILAGLLSENRIKIYYQPITGLARDVDSCYEILARVVDEKGGIMLPGELFSMAASAGMEEDVDRYIIERVLRLMTVSDDTGSRMFIKLTRGTVEDHDFPRWLVARLGEYRVDAGRLVFEVTEEILDSDLNSLATLTGTLSRTGCMFAIEHYRMQTNRQQLDRVHMDYLKIDRSLVQKLGDHEHDPEKVSQIMELARTMNLMTIAEGVESPEVLAVLWGFGVDMAQGYFIREPAGNPGN